MTISIARLISKNKINIIIFLCLIILILSIRGLTGNPNEKDINQKTWKEDGVFELSPERGRFALTYSLAEDHSIFFSTDIARFVTPDLGYWDGKYVSLFAPGVSFLVLPGYIIGKYIGISQVGTFAVITIFALTNFLLIRKISTLLGANRTTSIISGLVFLFATPAFAYAVNLYQHHISTFFMLLGIYLLLRNEKSWLNLFFIWTICAISALLIDYPNLFLMSPIGITALLKPFKIKSDSKILNIEFKFFHLLPIMGALLPITCFALFNSYSYGNPLRLSGTVPYIASIDDQGNPSNPDGNTEELIQALSSGETQSSINFFNPRNFINGFFIHLFSLDRGIIFYTPIIIFGLIGILSYNNRKSQHFQLLISIVLINLLLYSMWGDPWGGWAFGSRYLIPSYAIMSIFISIALKKYSRSIIFLIPFLISLLYSVSINTLGAITTSALPPRIQVLALEKLSGTIQKYTFERNWDFLLSDNSKSFLFQSFFHNYLSAFQYYCLILGIILIIFTYLFISLIKQPNENNHQ